MSVPWWYAVILAVSCLFVGLVAGNEWRLGWRGRVRRRPARRVEAHPPGPNRDVVVLDWSEPRNRRRLQDRQAAAEFLRLVDRIDPKDAA